MRKIIVIILSCLLSLNASAQRPDWPGQTYNVQRAMEHIDKGDYASAKESLQAEINENSKNGYAYLLLTMINSHDEQYGEALTSADKAIKYLPKRDKKSRAFAYYKRAGVHYATDEYDKALEDFSKAISLNGKDEDYYSERAQIYYEREQYDLADKDYQAMLKLDPNSWLAYMGLGRNLMAAGDLTEALKKFDHVVTLYPDYSSGYSFRAEARMKAKEYAEASGDIVKALSIDQDEKAFYLMLSLADSSFVHISTKLKSYAVNEPNESYWPYCLGAINEEIGNEKDAIDYYIKASKLDNSDVILYRIAKCHEELGNWKPAMEYIDKAINLDPKDQQYILTKADIYYKSGDIESAIKTMDQFIESNPDFYYGYYRRGWFKDNLRDADGAIEDYSTCIALNPDYTYAIMSRGDMYLLKGEKDLAMKDFEESVKRDTVPDLGSAAQYSLLRLGRIDEAKAWMQKIIDKHPEDSGVYYDAACLYSLMGDVDSSLGYLETSLKKGYQELHHIETDDDLDNIRDDARYKELISKYSESAEASPSESGESVEYVEKVSEVPFTRTGGVTSVKCEINGLPLHFVFDTGASEVTISRIEATFMFKNDYLTAADVIGKARYIDANGDISIGTVINLRKVTFAGLELENVRASVVDSNNAPLLLGQSVLSRLGKVEIDYEKGVLKITGRERVNN